MFYIINIITSNSFINPSLLPFVLLRKIAKDGIVGAKLCAQFKDKQKSLLWLGWKRWRKRRGAEIGEVSRSQIVMELLGYSKKLDFILRVLLNTSRGCEQESLLHF